jgi:hypothetical protein
MVAEVTGEYSYEPLRLPDDRDVSALHQDYGHILPVRLLTEGVNKYSAAVDARIRKTLRAQGRMWNLDPYGAEIEEVVAHYRTGAGVAAAVSGDARLRTAWDKALSHAAEQLRERPGAELDARFQAPEWEDPIKTILKKLYRGSEIRWVAGRQERGADVIVELPNYFRRASLADRSAGEELRAGDRRGG